MVLDDLRLFGKVFLLLGGVGFACQVGGAQLAEYVDVLAHQQPGLGVFLLVFLGFYLLFLH